MAFLADANFLIATLHARHTLSRRAVAWLDTQSDPRSILICRVVQMAALRILTNSAWMKDEVLSAAATWDAMDLLLSDSRFALVSEPARLEAEWRDLTRTLPLGRSADTDFYLAAFARAAGYHLLTFDRGFRRMEGLALAVLD